MKFIIDAQLPPRLARFLRENGHDVVHTDDLPLKERTPDTEIRRIAREDSRTVISKDDDFVQSYIIKHDPEQLLLISTGNIRNKELMVLFEKHLPTILAKFKFSNFIELDNDGVAERR